MALDTAFPADKKQPTQKDIFGLSSAQWLPKMGAGAQATPTSAVPLPYGIQPVARTREEQLNLESIQGLKREQGTRTDFQPTQSIADFLGTRLAPAEEPAGKGGFYAINRGVRGLPEISPEAPVAEAPAALSTPVPASMAAAPAKTASQSIIDWANQAPTSEQKGTRLGLAAKMMGAEAQTTAASTPSGRSSLQGLQDLGVETTYNELGMPVQTTKRSALYDPSTNTMVPIKLPTIAAKAPLPPKADLKSGQNYPGYGTWTGTGFRQQ
jgi:hypothetical protein